MEPRSAVGAYDKASGRWTFHVGSQGVFGFKTSLADILNEKPENVRILTDNVGGSFGMKAGIYPEYACILHAARLLGRPVKWTDDRSESFLSDCHGRDHDRRPRPYPHDHHHRGRRLCQCSSPSCLTNTFGHKQKFSRLSTQ